MVLRDLAWCSVGDYDEASMQGCGSKSSLRIWCSRDDRKTARAVDISYCQAADCSMGSNSMAALLRIVKWPKQRKNMHRRVSLKGLWQRAATSFVPEPHKEHDSVF